MNATSKTLTVAGKTVVLLPDGHNKRLIIFDPGLYDEEISAPPQAVHIYGSASIQRLHDFLTENKSLWEDKQQAKPPF